MSEFNWLHISDWHEGTPNFDRSVILKRLLEDVEAREAIHRSLAQLDAIIFSGDIAYSGKRDEFTAASKTLIQPLKDIVGQHVKLILAPGNHDLDRNAFGTIPEQWASSLNIADKNRAKKIGEMISNEVTAPALFSPFKNFYKFSEENGFAYSANTPVHSEIFEKLDQKIGITTINSAICCARHIIGAAGTSKMGDEVWDYGALSLSEQQLRTAIEKIEKCNLRILVLHHPISWFHPDEQPIIDQLITANFDLVLHGHEHLPRFTTIENNIAEIKYIPAGAAFEKRIPTDPRFTNAMNFGTFSVLSREGKIFHRRWIEERDRWGSDDRYWLGGFTSFVIRQKKKANPPGNRNAIAAIQKQYNNCFMKRAAKRVDVTIVHEKVTIDKNDYIQATIRYRLDLYPGEKEKFKFGTISSKRIAQSESKAVKDRAYELISLKPPAPKFENDGSSPNMKTGFVEIGEESSFIEYQYRILEHLDGVWFFSLQRFTDQVTINIRKSPDVDYEHLSLGGFPELQLDADGLLKFETMESALGHLPHQGVLLHWYRRENEKNL